ncbi:MAG: 3-methyl-2-oxobutanoate dehydrogenase subunit VorB [Planctomycetota bacterium]|nr:3-methyl-2-oxobutanoate dehydrogenase subunit VorB [Planctomycetota bacterium]
MKQFFAGNEAAAEGAVRAGCKVYFGYPITPQNEIPQYMSWRLPQAGGLFLQAESELAAINMVHGASSVGVRVMTSSSSPGISLKQEGISYMCGCELPAVIINVQRGGPGLGNIAPSQSDYFQATKGGGHGDYHMIVLAPHTVQEFADLTGTAFNLADEYRAPVLVLADGFLGQMMEPVEFVDRPPKIYDKSSWMLSGAKGRDPRIIRSLFLVEGVLEKHNIALQKKYDVIRSKEIRFEVDQVADADWVFIAYGTCARICRETMGTLREKGIKAGLFRPISLWPFPYEQIKKTCIHAKGILVVEMNSGQMLEDVRLAAERIIPIYFYGRLGGGVPGIAALSRRIEELEAASKSGEQPPQEKTFWLATSDV